MPQIPTEGRWCHPENLEENGFALETRLSNPHFLCSTIFLLCMQCASRDSKWIVTSLFAESRNHQPDLDQRRSTPRNKQNREQNERAKQSRTSRQKSHNPHFCLHSRHLDDCFMGSPGKDNKTRIHPQSCMFWGMAGSEIECRRLQASHKSGGRVEVGYGAGEPGHTSLFAKRTTPFNLEDPESIGVNLEFTLHPYRSSSVSFSWFRFCAAKSSKKFGGHVSDPQMILKV